MAATSLAGRECAGRDAILSAPLQVSAQRNGQFRPVHLDCRVARGMAAHPVPTVAGASAVRDGARSGAGRCPAPCRELDHGCRWASGGKELVCVLGHQELRLQGALLRVSCRAALGVLLLARHSGPNALRPVVPQGQAGAVAWALAVVPQQVREQLQAPRVSLPRDLAQLWVPLAAQQAQREPPQQAESWELPSAQREPPDGLRADVPRVHVPRDGLQAHVLQAHQRRVPRVSPEPEPLHAARAASARLLPPLLSTRAPRWLLLRRRQHPSSGAGLFPQLRQGWNWSAFSFPLRQTPQEGQ